MITEVPTKDDFRHAGIAYLNLAWDTVINLTTILADAGLEKWDTENSVPDEYWQAAQRPLATAVSLVQQGTEFLLKSKIAEVSPFLLFAGSPMDWPRGCNRTDIAFAEFKTIDAHELIRACDTVTATKLSDAFVERFERLRRYRNTVMHTVDPRLRFTASEIVEAILEVSESLIGSRRWTEIRREFMTNEPVSVAHSPDHVEPALAQEFLQVIKMLKPAQLRRYFNFDPRQRRYYCQSCQMASADWNLEVMTAQLRPNSPTSTTLYCFICRGDVTVIRRSCKGSNCRGNVLDAVDETCLTCYE